jgi:hypothetical protein
MISTRLARAGALVSLFPISSARRGRESGILPTSKQCNFDESKANSLRE